MIIFSKSLLLYRPKVVIIFLANGASAMEKGLMVSVNSDDPSYFGGYINTNLIECQKALNLSRDDVKRLAINSFKSSFLNEIEKKKWINHIINLN